LALGSTTLRPYPTDRRLSIHTNITHSWRLSKSGDCTSYAVHVENSKKIAHFLQHVLQHNALPRSVKYQLSAAQHDDFQFLFNWRTFQITAHSTGSPKVQQINQSSFLWRLLKQDFYRLDAQPTLSKHWRGKTVVKGNKNSLPLVESYPVHHSEHAREHAASDHFRYQS